MVHHWVVPFRPIRTIPYAPIYSEDTGNHDKEFTE